MRKKMLRRLSSINVIIYVLALLLPIIIGSRQASAGTFQATSVRLGRMAINQSNIEVLVIAKPNTTGTEAKVVVTMGTAAGFQVNQTATAITVSTASLPSTYMGVGVSAWSGIGTTASSVASQVITFTSSDLTVGGQYGFRITAGVGTSGTAGQYTVTVNTQTGASATIDTQDVAVRVVADDTVTVTATVAPTFSFVLGTNSQALGTLSTTASTSGSGVSVTVSTNNENGWVGFVKSANTYLGSTATSDQINTAGSVDDAVSTYSAGSEFYQLDAEITTDAGGGGTVTIDSEYNGNGTTTGGTYSTSFEEFATTNGYANGDVVGLYPMAAISAVNLAASDYTDTLTIVGAGNF